MKHQMIGAGFAVLGTTRLHRALAPLTRGIGAILTLHRVRPFPGDCFAPNRPLEIEPTFLDAALTRIATLGYDFVSLDEAMLRLAAPNPHPFVALTFDDGYRDTAEVALPILERHGAPFAVFVTTGFADRTVRMWWVEIEDAIRSRETLDLDLGDRRIAMRCRTLDEKRAAFAALSSLVRARSDAGRPSVVDALDPGSKHDPRSIAEALCLDWHGVRALARHPLCTIGAHTLSHPRLALLDAASARREIAESRAIIEERIGLPVRHFAYPFGDAASAGPREAAVAAGLGFSSAVTTRPGLIHAAHVAHRTALPRLSLNGSWQRLDALEILLSGVPFALWNGGRRVVT